MESSGGDSEGTCSRGQELTASLGLHGGKLAVLSPIFHRQSDSAHCIGAGSGLTSLVSEEPGRIRSAACEFGLAEKLESAAVRSANQPERVVKSEHPRADS